MPAYGDVIYNITGIKVAALNSSNQYTTPYEVEYVGSMSFEFDHATDEIMSKGMIVEKLSIAREVQGTLQETASLAWNAYSVMTGLTETETGAGDSQIKTTDFLMGGSGLPYFGMICSVAAQNGANVLIGFAKCMLETYPPFAFEQNAFRKGEISFNAIAPVETIRKAVRVRKYESSTPIPSAASGWNTFFTGFMS